MSENNNQTEVLYLIDNARYLHVQECDDGYDYTFFDRNTLKATDGGQVLWEDIPDLHDKPLEAARITVFE